ncbi:glucosylceramide transporter ABCA12 [Phlebotomus argentipes]|uniref:glucosylceramide transporter ABCA12 n=1 Tax=Phlebotomus argentipes TaxID=94469 RepID=UPI002892F040|nr:glucosylceramide transporter ABCA12 [Phlebotomus argentipes]
MTCDLRRMLNVAQIKALLWKNVLVRIRQPLMTIVQYMWPCLVFLSLYTARTRFEPELMDPCQFPTRQLPSDNQLLHSIHSYICTFENQCLPVGEYQEVSAFPDAPLTPALNIIQTFLNEPSLFDAVTGLAERLEFIPAIIAIAANKKFSILEGNIKVIMQRLPEYENLLGASFDVKQLFSDDRMLSESGKIMCGKPFPRADNIQLVDQVLASEDFSDEDRDEIDAMPTPFCKQLYKDVTKTNYGKITWSFLKPIIQGKILYGPISEKNDKIIENANTTFHDFGRLRLFAKSIEHVLIQVKTNDEVRDKFLKLLQLTQSPFVQSIISSANLDPAAIEGMFNGILYDNRILDTVTLISSVLDCFSADRFVGVTSEEELEKMAVKLHEKKLFWAGVYFQHKSEKDFGYKLRMTVDDTPKTSEKKSAFWFPGPEGSFELDLKYHRGFVHIQQSIDLGIIKSQKVLTPPPVVEESDDDEDDDFDSGLSLDADDDLVDDFESKNITTSKTTTESAKTSTNGQENVSESESVTEEGTTPLTTETPQDTTNAPLSRQKRAGIGDIMGMMFGDSEKEVYYGYQINTAQYYTKQFPYPKYTKDTFKRGLYMAHAVQMTFFFALIVNIAFILRDRVWMKESGNSSLMRAMGLLRTSEDLTWFMVSIAELGFVFFASIFILYSGGILSSTNKIFLFFYLMTYGACILAFCYMCSSFFASASIACVSSVILFLSTFLPYILVIFFDAKLTAASRFITNLSFSTAFCNAWHYILRQEIQFKDLSFHNAFTGSTNDNEFKYGYLMLLLDMLVYLVIGFISERFRNNESNFYDVPTKNLDSQTGAVMTKVSKYYDTSKLAVSSVSIAFKRDQITCLLGRNGAGKSTIIKMLTGQILPSSGELYIQTSRKLKGKHVGLCSQNNILIPQLTAKEHLSLYAAIKIGNDYHEEVRRVLDVLSLGKYERYMSSELSGGYKRRLSIGIAFLGSPSLVILDEPCSAIDSKARKNIWELVEKLKKGRAIVLATHYLDEAEHLGDNIVLMNNGKIMTETSPSAVKNELTQSFVMKVTLPQMEEVIRYQNIEDLKTVIENQIPNASYDIQGHEISITLPYYTNSVLNDYEPLLKVMEKMEDEGKIVQLNIVSKNLEDIFNQYNASPNGNYHNGAPPLVLDKKLTLTKDSKPKFQENQQMGLVDLVKILFWKRITHFRRNYRALISILLLPAIFELIAMGFMKLRPPDDYDVALKFTPENYPGSKEFYSLSNGNNFTSGVYNRITEHCTGNDSCEIFDNSKEAFKWILKTNDEYEGRRYGGSTFNDSRAIVWYNNKGYHSMPSYLNQLNNALFKEELNDTGYSIEATNHPFKLGQALSTTSVLQQVADAAIALILLVAMSLVLAGGSVFIVSERVSGEKLQQKLCGVSRKIYWAVAFSWDFLIYIGAIILAVIIFKIFALPIFVARSQLYGFIMLLFFFGFALIPSIHVAEKFFSDASYANMTIFCLNIIIALSTLAIILMFDIIGESEESVKVRNFLNRAFLIFPQHALSDGLLELCKNYITAVFFTKFGIDSYKSPIASDLLAPHISLLIVVGVAAMITNYVIESGLWRVILAKVYHEKNFTGELQIVSIQNTLQKDTKFNLKDKSNCLVAENLSKTYGKGVLALNNVSFAVKSGECFGLLGANGAGKSTIFGILSGQFKQTSGTVEFMDCKGISYCPQTNAVDNLLTVREVITFYGKLRMIDNLHSLVANTLATYHLEPYENVLVKNLSGGNRRKLSVAVTCMGNTSLVLMDEPTSDMDPVTRSLVYKSIENLIKQNRSVLLTSHTISEIDNVCHRIAILKNGQIISTGTPSELKTTCGNSYAVTIFFDKVESLTIERDLKREFPNVESLMIHSHTLQFIVQVKSTNCTTTAEESPWLLSELFSKLHRFCADRNISFTVSQCLLDRVFERILDSEPSSYVNQAFVQNETAT